MLLTDSERQRFADYLEVDAHSSDELAKQLEKMGAAYLAPLIKMHKTQATAARIVAKKLRDAQSMTLGPADTKGATT